MEPLMDQYLKQVEHQEIVRDPGQLKVVEALQCALDRMNHQGWWCRLFKKRQQGVFIWGDVGVGKTWLMDQFYRAAPEKKKIRYHYHEFMEMLHGSMPDHKHRPNPLDAIANKLAGHYRLICIDEFHVTEIADAMLLYGILEGLFKRQVMLVTTSNRVPDRLYEKGFHRDLFLPAIELLKRYNMVVELESHTDYRVANSEVSRQQVVQELGQPELEAIFANLAQSEPWEQHSLQINQRTLPVIKVAEGAVWLKADRFAPYDYWQFWRNPEDADVGRFLKLFTNLPLDEITRLHEYGRLATGTHARRRSSGDDVARAEAVEFREVADQLRQIEDQIVGVRRLHDLAVEGGR